MESIIWFLVLGGLFYFMMKFGCGAHIGGHGGHAGGHEDHAGHGRPSTSSQKVKDPVCGMEIDRDQAHSMVRDRKQQIFFCSETCHNKFNEEPEKYL